MSSPSLHLTTTAALHGKPVKARKIHGVQPPVSKATLPTLPLMLEKAYLLSRVHPQATSVRQAAHDLLEKYMDILQTIPYYKFLEEKAETASDMEIDSYT